MYLPSFKYPLKHISLNELPTEMFPQPMRKVNYNIKELKNILPQKTTESLKQDLPTRQRRAQTEHSQSIPKRFRNNNNRSFTTPARHQMQSPKTISKTEKLFRLQTESSQEARRLISQGSTVFINLHDQNVAQGSISQFNQQKPSLNDQTNRFLNETQKFHRKKEQVCKAVNEKLYYFYQKAFNENLDHKDYLEHQMAKYRSFVVDPPQNDISKSERKLALLEHNRRKAHLKETQKLLYNTHYSQPHQNEQPHNQFKTPLQTKMHMQKAKELKTLKHHRLISQLNSRTQDLFDSWQQTQPDDMIQERVKLQQMRIMERNKDMNMEAQLRLKNDMGQILKMLN